jgi:phospholipase/carboxylesterase
MHYEERYAYPLIVWLHDSDSNEQELRQVMPLVSMRNYVAVAPRGTSEGSRLRGRFDWRQSANAIESAHSRIVDCVALAQDRFNVHPERIFLVGRGAGGTMALRTAWSDPDRFAAVAAINGPLPAHSSPMRRVNELRHLPCLLATSRDHAAYPPDHVCRDLKLLHAAGCTVALRQYPGGDDLTSNMLSDLDRWLMELVCGTQAVSNESR